ncbi:T9SS type B sorting domain-containing protein [Olleya sp. YS]|uniref:T9SS type B sorting domain-containing protein n=1 Tax=Olleya sp. YS TaxID=3028318 RepID=UPI002434179E|nr:T9SS type B sorting domain-containing protein [Olleya sp. YS]WGD34551.1 T9SS type B sorting domain-containing protein [Olleya sp. YS]
MKSLYFSIFFLFALSIVNAQTTVIPDANFEQELINQGIDTNGLNGNILDADAQAINTLNLAGNAISDITGISAFVNLTSLDLGTNPVIDVDLSALVLLTEFTTDDNDALNSIDFTQNILLEMIFLESNFTTPGDPPITVIDLSQNINLIEIDIDNLRNVTDLILPITPTLTDIYVRYLADISLDFSLLDGLEDLNIGGSAVNNVVITLPNVFTVLKTLRISSIDIPTIDISNYINLESLYLWGTYVENLLLPNSTTLTDIFIIIHDIQNPLDFSVLPNLEDLDITSNQTTPLVVDLTQNYQLVDLDLSRNDMDTIDLTQNTLLETIRLNVNNFTTINITQNVLVDRFEAYSNQLPSMDLTQNAVLRYLVLRDNVLPTLDLTQNLELRSADLSINLLPNLDVTQNLELNSLDISQNLFTTTGLDLTQNVNLYTLRASYNQIESLDITQNIVLSTLIIDHNLFPGTAILDQFYTIRLNAGGIGGGALIVSYNLLTGQIPDFASLVEMQNGTPIGFDLAFDNNYFEFGHFEDQHANLVIHDNTPGPAPSWTWLDNIEDYFYAPQAKVDTIDTINANAGDSVTLTTVCAGTQNHYTWFKDGVAIPGAPDSPNYTIPSLDSCDDGIYYTEITSDLVLFENTNPPGTGGKNLLLIRNDITLNVTSPSEDCVTLINPLSGATNVALNETLEWNANLGACGYFLSIGTTPGGTDILNNADVGDVTSYNIGSNFPSNTQIYVTITPYFYSGNTLSCPEESFTTGTTESPTSCTTLILPTDGAIDVPITTNLEWNPSPYAIGYILNIGTTPGGDDIVSTDVENSVTTYNPSINLPESTLIYVTIIPYNNLGYATGCIEESFTTEGFTPNCTTLSSPINNAINVLVNTDVSWNSVMDATGYNLSVGTTSGGTDILNNQDVGNVTNFDLPADLPFGTQIYVSIIPYNTSGSAVGCTEESFITEQIPPICTNLSSPLNGVIDVSIATDLSWNVINNATGYLLTVGTTSGGTDIINNQDLGNVTTFNLPTDLPDETQIFVTITPYNSAGNAIGCAEESFTTEVVTPLCTSLISPLGGAVDVSIATDVSWTAIGNATGYLLIVGTTSGGTNIVNNQDVGSVTTFDLPTDLPDETQIFVTIIPYNSAGNAIGCIEESFTTEVVIPLCTSLASPLQGAINVSIATDVSWTAIGNATGYFLTVGTTSGGTDIINNQDVGNVTTFDLPTDLPDETQIFVTITPYNSAGNAFGCTEESFTTEVVIPLCTSLISPLDGAVDVSIATDISWTSIGNATGYLLTVGTTSGATNIVNNQDVGNVTTFDLPMDLPGITQIFVSITPYNSAGNALGCTEESFITELPPPSCSNLISPFFQETDVALDTDLAWSASDYADGYLITIGTNTGLDDILATVDVGNVLSYDIPFDLPNNTTVYVTVTSYNATGGTVCGDDQFTTEDLTPLCVSLTAPLNGETNVAINTNISWQPEINAEGYILTMGTTAGGNDLVNAIDVGNITTYNYPNILPQNTQIFVSAIPYNYLGQATGCIEESFTTELLIPDCTSLSSPFNGETNVSITTDLNWAAIAYTDGYILSVGTTSGGTDLINGLDVGNVTSYAFAENWPDDTTIYVTIIPYNSVGSASNCSEVSFTTEVVIPDCTYLISPFNTEIDVLVGSLLTWETIDNAIGYIVSIGTTPNGTDIADAIDVGNSTTYQPTTDFVDNTNIYVSIIPYNTAGNALGCVSEQFTTENRSIITPSFFTPNDDAYNQYWKVQDPKNEIKTIYIFDRFGKLIKSFGNTSVGWDGTFNGDNLPTDDYWYLLELFDGTIQKGHFTLKR